MRKSLPKGAGLRLPILLAMCLVCIFFHYPQLTRQADSPYISSTLELTRFTFERALFLIPVIYTGIVFGFRAGLASVFIALGVMLPQAFINDTNLGIAVLELIGFGVVCVLVFFLFDVKRKENRIYKQLSRKLEESERGMTVSEKKYRYLFENASDAIWTQDINGVFIDGNRAFEKLTGFTRKELKGVQLAQFLSAESLTLAREIRDKLARGEEFEQPYEQQFSIKGGSVITVQMSTNPIISGNKINGYEHVARDITLEKQQQENVLAYIQQITRAQEEERKRIARDLHDDVSPHVLILIQKLDNITSGQRMKLSVIKDKISDLRHQAVQSLESLRQTAQGLRPRILDDLGLAAALEWIAEELERSIDIETSVEVNGIDRELTPETQILLFRIAQEALNNVRKHTRATRASIKVEGKPEGVTMTVTDNGEGFQVPVRFEDMVSDGRLGLMGMYERAKLLNGNLSIKSSNGQGTEIIVNLPWQGESSL